MTENPEVVTDNTGRLMEVEWPSRAYPTLQSAVDSLADGGTLMIKEGIYEIAQPVVISDKRINIIGNGADCKIPRHEIKDLMRGNKQLKKYLKDKEYKGFLDAKKRRPKNHQVNATVLIGPTPDRVVAPERVQPIFSYENGGGLLQGVELVGGDAGILSKDHNGSSRQLYVKDTCIRDTGRGILWKATSPVSVKDTIIENISWNAISISPNDSGYFVFNQIEDSYTFDVENFCIYLENTSGVIEDNLLVNCKHGGIVAYKSPIAFINGNGIFYPVMAGIMLETSTAVVDDNYIRGSKGDAGPNGPVMGDGITAWWGTNMISGDDNYIFDSERAAVSSFGSYITLYSSNFACQLFDWAGNPSKGYDYAFHNLGDNWCGCGIEEHQCKIDSATIEPPDPVGGLE